MDGVFGVMKWGDLMMYVSVYVDEDEIIDDIDDKIIEKEFAKRFGRGPITTDREKRRTLIDAADFLRTTNLHRKRIVKAITGL